MRVALVATIVVFALVATIGFAHSPKNDGAEAAGAAFLAQKASEPGVYELPSGTLFKVIKKGTGDTTPLIATPCSVHYSGSLADGTKFDSSYDRGSPSTFAPNQVIAGWKEVLQLMREGDKWEVYIPYNLAYGVNGRPPKIPPYSPLVFTMELLKIKGPSKQALDIHFQSYFGKTYAEI